MDKKDILTAIQEVRKTSPKKKFTQSLDLIINLKDLNLKRETDKVNTFFQFPFSNGKKVKICALVDQALVNTAKKNCDHVILTEAFNSLDKKQIKKLGSDYDYFVAQANIMPAIAKAFGKTLGPKGKMPNPKAGCVVQPTEDLTPVVKKLQNTVKLETKNELAVKVRAGTEAMKDEELADNIFAVYDKVIHSVPQEMQNVKNVMIKLTMGKPVLIGQEIIKEEATTKTKKEAKKK